MSKRRTPKVTLEQRLTAAAACPDCNSSVELGPRWSEGNVWVPRVRHDPTCLRLAQLRRDGLTPIIRIPDKELEQP